MNWFQIYDGDKHVARVDPGMKVVFHRPVHLLVDRAIPGGSTSDAHRVEADTQLEYVGQHFWGHDPGPGFPKFRLNDLVGYVIEKSYDWGCFRNGEVSLVETPKAKAA